MDNAFAKDSVPVGVSVNPLLVFILVIASEAEIVSETALLICSISDDVTLAESESVTSLDNNVLIDSETLAESVAGNDNDLTNDWVTLGVSAKVLFIVHTLAKLSVADGFSVDTLLN